VPRFLNTRGNTTLAIGICGRCSIKMPLDKLLPDPNYLGLLVCEKDMDQYDPYRLPARQPDNLLLPFTRPDTPIPTNPAGVIAQNGDQFLITEDSDDYLIFFEDDEF
jgi:hypothetical protein